jgi:hypothetical protein
MDVQLGAKGEVLVLGRLVLVSPYPSHIHRYVLLKVFDSLEKLRFWPKE